MLLLNESTNRLVLVVCPPVDSMGSFHSPVLLDLCMHETIECTIRLTKAT